MTLLNVCLVFASHRVIRFAKAPVVKHVVRSQLHVLSLNVSVDGDTFKSPRIPHLSYGPFKNAIDPVMSA